MIRGSLDILQQVTIDLKIKRVAFLIYSIDEGIGYLKKVNLYLYTARPK